MTTYAIGDIQGCYTPLLNLLELIRFDAARDRLWFVGDLVNRGPDSLQVLRFVKSLGERAITVLGNHDLHLLAVADGIRKPTRKDSLNAILEAPDRDDLLLWLRHRPLANLDADTQILMVHAGVAPDWTAADTVTRAAEVETVLRGPNYHEFFAHMYGNYPDTWNDALQGMERLRVITNYLTRMRCCDEAGRLDLDFKGPPAAANAGFLPWFAQRKRRTAQTTILFGHWAALDGKSTHPMVHALDTGCVWGERLRALRIDDMTLFHCNC